MIQDITNHFDLHLVSLLSYLLGLLIGILVPWREPKPTEKVINLTVYASDPEQAAKDIARELRTTPPTVLNDAFAG